MTKVKSSTHELHTVFDHTASPEEVEKLRSAVVHDVHWMCSTFINFERVTVDDLDPKVCRALKEKYGSLLHFGSFNLPRKRLLANELIWKWTEATGKYVGCQFWSKHATALFGTEVVDRGGWPITENSAKAIEKKLSAKGTGGKPRPSNTKLTHEHVYPINDMKKLLRKKDRQSLEGIRHLFDFQCMSCVVLESEHDRLCGQDANPWIRYANAKIMLEENPAWPTLQREMISQAGLLK